MNKAELLEALRGTRFAKDIDLLEPLIRPSVRMSPVVVDPADLPIGASHFGGAPDLPDEIEWPRFEGRPLDFLCQFDLAEVQALGPFDDLPDSGWLLFFYDYIEMPWGNDPKDRGSWRVLHIKTGSGSLGRRSRPAQRVAERPDGFTACALDMRSEVCLPDAFDFLFPYDIDNDQIYDDYVRILEETETTVEPFPMNHRLLGHPAIMQDDMRRDMCQLVLDGLGPGVWKDHRMKLPIPAAEEWQLLLQLDTDETGPGWSWALGGRLYFLIRQEDLDSRLFDEVWAVVQAL